MRTRIRRIIPVLIASVWLVLSTSCNLLQGTPVFSGSADFDTGGTRAESKGETLSFSGPAGDEIMLNYSLELSSSRYKGDIAYRSYISDYGWQSWLPGGELSGAVGNNRAICGVQIMLMGHLANYYDISYRVNLQSSGWQDWVSNGCISGALEEPVIGLEVKLEEKQGDIRDTEWTLTQYGDDDGRQAEFYTMTNNDDGTLIVIDGGWDANTEQVRSIINIYGGKVDYWFLTHYDADHVSAFNNIYADPQGITIGTIYATPLDYDLYCTYAEDRWWDTPEVYKLFLDQTAGDDRVIFLSRGDSFEITGLQINVYNSYDQMIADYGHPDVANLASLVFKITGKEDSVLFCGDMLSFLGMDLLDMYGDALDAEYVQPGHHGNIDISYEFYEALNPKVMFFDGPAWLNESDEYYSKGLIEWCQANDILTYDFGTAPNCVSFE